ncbi:hypothetical protein GF386_05775 [Candidatus Pacearchaeota archaeon]|nr:hypothetical protein [Candidatus Pacearchaeota archaeon]MBD3283602.1 hypothetical protein [Candidatus Pacearchaeota archaeon]
MKSIDEIENSYKKTIENLDKEFLERIKTENKRELENYYKKKLNEAKTEYEEEYKKFLEKKKKPEKEKKRKRKGKKSKLEIKSLKLKISRKERIRLKWDLLKFRLKIKIKDLEHKLIPDFLITIYIKNKLMAKRLWNSFKRFISKTIENFKDSFKLLLKSLKTISIKTFLFSKKIIKNLIKKTSGIFKKKKKQEKHTGNEEREDVKIAEKILAEKKKSG